MSIETEMQAVIDRYVDAYIRHDLAAIGAIYSDAASIYSPYGPAALGNAAVVETHKDWFSANEQNKRLSMLRAEAVGDLAYCVMQYAGDFPDEAGNLVTESGVSMNVLKRHADGLWQIHITSLTSDRPPHT
jgi:ketosteroid isomerase-like protein